jgi:hypothetical protein
MKKRQFLGVLRTPTNLPTGHQAGRASEVLPHKTSRKSARSSERARLRRSLRDDA